MKNYLRYGFFAFLSVLASAAAFAQSGLQVTSGTDVVVKSGTTFSVDSLVLTPSADFTISDANRITRTTAATTAYPGTALNRAYLFQNSIPSFSGAIGIYYQNDELNGLPESSLVLSSYDGTAWKYHASNVSRNATNNIVTTTGLAGLTLNELTLAREPAALVAPSIVFDNVEKTYGAANFNLTATSNSSGTITYSVVSGTGAAVSESGEVTITGSGSVIVKASQSANGNYTTGDTTATLVINKATTATTVSVSNATYDGTTHDGSASVTGAGGLSQPVTVHYTGVSPTAYASSTTAPTNAGTYTASATYAATDNYQTSTDSKNFTIDKATVTPAWAAGTLAQTYDGSVKTVVATTTPAGLTISYDFGALTPKNAGSYPVTATITDDNYEGSLDGILEIAKAATTTIVSVSNAHEGSANVTGAGGLNQAVTVYYEGVPPTVYASSTTAPTNAGTYTASATYAATENYQTSTDSKKFTIAKATVTLAWSAGTLAQTYDGSVKAVSASATPAGLTISYDFGALTPKNAGSYPVTATITDDNYEGSLNGTLEIAKAATTTAVSVGNAAYDGIAHAGSANVTGAGGLSQAVTVYYEGVSPTVYASSTTAPTNAGTYRASATYAGSNNYFGSVDSKNFTITLKTITVTATNAQRQYSDPNPSLTGTLTGVVSGDGITPSYTTTADLTSAPGTYIIKPVLSDPQGKLSNYTVNSTNGTLTVAQENANVTYSGTPYFSTASTTNYTATVTLSATVQDITAVPGDPKYDAYPGNITNAKVTFHRDGPTGPILGTANVPVVLVGTDTKTGTASMTFTYRLTTSEVNSYGTSLNVYAVAGDGGNGYYTGVNVTPGVVTISIPGSQSVNGGGYVKNTSSTGTYAGTAGVNTNFGFTMQYSKSGSAAKGQANIIVRSNNKTYQIKSNAINSLSVGTTTASGTPASFTTKATLTDITNPLYPVAIAGNLDLFVNLNDVSTGGQGDQVSILLQSGSKILFSSNWNGTKTVLQTLGGGNVQARLKAAPKAANNDLSQPIVGALTLKAFPNPSTQFFTLKLQSRVNEKVQLKVFDASGRPVYLTEGSSNQTYRFGDSFASGSYFLQVTQGKKKQTLKLIKLK